jgi:hypothetical protein
VRGARAPADCLAALAYAQLDIESQAWSLISWGTPLLKRPINTLTNLAVGTLAQAQMIWA